MRIPWLSGVFDNSTTSNPAQPQRIRVTHEPVKPAIRVTHQEPVKVKPTPVPVWQEQGWRRSGLGIYVGKYQTSCGSWEGRIEAGLVGVSRALIKAPPAAIKRHPHYTCFVHLGGDWFELHWNDKPRSVDEAIVNMERILREAFEIEQSYEKAGYGYRIVI